MVIRGFRKCGISVAIDSSEDDEINIKGLEGYQVESDEDESFAISVMVWILVSMTTTRIMMKNMAMKMIVMKRMVMKGMVEKNSDEDNFAKENCDVPYTLNYQ